MRIVLAAALLAVAVPGVSSVAAEPPPLAVLPVDNATGFAAPLDDVGRALEAALRGEGLVVTPSEHVRAFLASRRIRYTGGLGVEALRVAGEELGVGAVVACSVDLFVEEVPPRVGLALRVIRSADGAIVWAYETARAGEDRPGVLGIGEIENPAVLVDRAVADAARSVREGLTRASATPDGRPPVWDRPSVRRTFRPRRVFHDQAPEGRRQGPTLLAVLPFDTLTQPSQVGDTVANLFTIHLAGRDRLTVIEPGEVREALIRNRIIQQSGLSLAQAEALRVHLGVDLIVTGQVLSYDDRGPGSAPKVEISVRVIDAARRVVLWSCLSANEGDDGVTPFGTRRLTTARALASAMVRSAADAFAAASVGPPPE